MMMMMMMIIIIIIIIMKALSTKVFEWEAGNTCANY